MTGSCRCKVTYDLKVEADIGADALWCKKCFCNFNIEDFSISNDLKVELSQWIQKYGKWIDWDNNGLIPNGAELEEIHNEEGLKLTEKVQKELLGKYKVSFSPSIIAKHIQMNDNNHSN